MPGTDPAPPDASPNGAAPTAPAPPAPTPPAATCPSCNAYAGAFALQRITISATKRRADLWEHVAKRWRRVASRNASAAIRWQERYSEIADALTDALDQRNAAEAEVRRLTRELDEAPALGDVLPALPAPGPVFHIKNVHIHAKQAPELADFAAALRAELKAD